MSGISKKPKDIDYVLEYFYSLRGKLVRAICSIDRAIDDIRRKYEDNANE